MNWASRISVASLAVVEATVEADMAEVAVEPVVTELVTVVLRPSPNRQLTRLRRLKTHSTPRQHRRPNKPKRL